MRTLTLDGLTFTVTRTAKKRISLHIGTDGRLRASVLPDTTDERLFAFIREKRPWIDRHLPAAAPAAPGEGTLPFWGRQVPVSVIPGRKAAASLTGGVLTVTLPRPDDRAQYARALHAFYAAELTRRLRALIPVAEQEARVHAHKWTIRAMKSRWGSCNVKTGAISINLLLAAYPEDCLHGVIIHELTHLKEKGHNPRFYALMDAAWPAWRAADPLLKKSVPALAALWL